MSARQKPKTESEPKAPEIRVVPGGTKGDIARAKELIEKYGLQRLLHDKK